MNAEVKKITYTPEVVDQVTGELKKPAHFAVNLNVDVSEETREALMDVMAGGSPFCNLELVVQQPTLQGVPSVTQAQHGERL